MNLGALSLSLLVLALLSGCLGDDGGSDGNPGDGADSGGETGNGGGASGNDTPAAPAVLNFSFGPSLGCEGSMTGQGNCVSFQAGPSARPVDGFWVPLGVSYGNLSFTSTIDNQMGDSDCYLVNDARQIVGDFNQGAAVCSGKMPAGGGAYLFLYSYQEPSFGMTLTFTAPEKKAEEAVALDNATLVHL